MEELSKRINNLSPEKRKLLALRLQKQLSDTNTSVHKRLVAYIVPKEKSKLTNGESRLSSAEIRSYLQKKLPEYMIPAVFVELESLPRTPNGKIDIKALPAPDAKVSTSENSLVAPRTPREKILADIWSEVLGLEEISIDDNFFEVGGDSILSIQIVSKAREAGLMLMPNQLFEHQTIAELAATVSESSIIEVKQELLTGSVPLTPIQHWFFEQNLPEAHHWNQVVILEVEPNVDLKALGECFDHLLEHHDALRLRFGKTDQGWEQHYGSSVERVRIEEIDLSQLNSIEQKTEFENQVNYWQGSLNLSTGNILRVILFKLGDDQPHRFLIVIHHLAVDGVSWRVLLEDIVITYQQLTQGKSIQLPAKTTSYQQWGEKLIAYAQSEQIKTQMDYWLSLSNYSDQSLPLDRETNLAENTEASAVNLTVCLSELETKALLQEVPSVYNTQINDLLLTALVQSFAQWTGQSSLLLDLEGHGRENLFEGIDLSRTIGWFTSVFPVRLELKGNEQSQPGEAIKSIKEQIRQIPEKGIGYGILRYLSPDKSQKKQLSSLPSAQVLFNYLGQWEQIVNSPPILKLASESTGLSHSSKGKRLYLIEVNSRVVQGKLEIIWTYSEKFHNRETIEQLGQSYLTALQSLITHCQSPEAGGFTPSDFPEANLNQEDLDNFLSSLIAEDS